MTFSSKIAMNGVNPYVLVIAQCARRLRPNWRRPMPVGVRINQKPADLHRINLMPVGDGSFYLYLNDKIRVSSATKVGDTVSVEIEFDAEYRAGPSHPMPPSFRVALDKNPRAKQTWDALSPSRKKEVLRHFAKLKRADTCEQNVQRAVDALSGGESRFLGRYWTK